MRLRLYGSELSLIHESPEELEMLKKFEASVEKGLVDIGFDGVNDDELVLNTCVDFDASHCSLCGKRYDAD